MTSRHVVNALGDGDWAVVTVPHPVDGRDIVERHWGWSVPGEWEETDLVKLEEVQCCFRPPLSHWNLLRIPVA